MSTDFHTSAYLTRRHTKLHSSEMDYPAVLRSIMKAGKVNQDQLAKRLKVTQPTISRWLKGTKPEVGQHQRIVAEAARLGILRPLGLAGDAAPFEADDSAPPGVKVVGYVGAGAEAHYYAVAQGDLDEVPAPDGVTLDTVAVEIRGNSLGEMFDRWLVFYDSVRRPVTPDLIGRLCVVGLADDRVLIKKIRRGHNGLYDLHSNMEDPIKGVMVEWAARVKLMV